KHLTLDDRGVPSPGDPLVAGGFTQPDNGLVEPIFFGTGLVLSNHPVYAVPLFTAGQVIGGRVIGSGYSCAQAWQTGWISTSCPAAASEVLAARSGRDRDRRPGLDGARDRAGALVRLL